MKNTGLCLLVGTTVLALTVACGGGEQAPAPTPAPAEPAAAPAPATGGGSVSGLVTYSNGDPDTAINMDADPVCSGLHEGEVTTQQVAITDGNLANVFVYLKDVSGSHPAPADPVVLDQQGCTYHPHVSGIQVGQKLIIRNSDPTLHNVHALPTANTEFNQGQPFEVMVRFKCDVHPWMSAWMGVMSHPFYAVSAEDGSFSIENVPAGEYTLEAWHETLGTKSQAVTVAEDGDVAVSFDFSPAAG
jgi:hypothetical protein